MSLLGAVIGAGVGTAASLLSGPTPTMDMSGYTSAYNLINKQASDIDKYYQEADTSLESQFKSYYGQQMQDTVNALAAHGTYNSPVSQLQLNRTTQKLADTYANAKSTLAGQKLSAESNIETQMANYQMNLANAQYQQQLADYNSKNSLISSIGGLVGGVIGSLF